MKKSPDNLETIREYLLGRITDEKTLEGVEELLFSDDDFCTKAEIIEDELINEYVYGNLSTEDCNSFEKTLVNNSERRLKVQVTQALKEKVAVKPVVEKATFLETIKTLFRSPMYSGGFAVLLVTALIGTVFLIRSPQNDELAELRNIYAKERPVEPRISGFDYAPLNITRGENKDEANKNKLKIEELKFRQAIVENPIAENHYKLGVFLLTQQQFTESIRELQNAVKLEDKNAKYHNDLGTAYLALSENDKSNLQPANEEFSKALEIDSNSLEALFNKSLALQKLTMTNQARESWENYLKKDSTSKWADEARKNLERIAQFQSRFKKKEEVLEDFLNAYRSGNYDLAKMIHNQTKGMHNVVSLPRQLARSYLEARVENNESNIKESISALRFIGTYEQENHADFFVAKIAEFYSEINSSKIKNILQTHIFLEDTFDFVKKRDSAEAIKRFEKSRNDFMKEGDVFANISELWAASFLQYISKNTEGITRLNALINIAETNNYKTIHADAIYWLGICMYSQLKFSEIKLKIDIALKIAEQTQNHFKIGHLSEYLGNTFLDLGELDKSQEYASKILQAGEIYYQSESNFWRNQLFFSDLAKRMQFYSTALDFGKESLFVARKILPELTTVSTSLNEISNALVKKKQFDEALKYAHESNKIALEKEDSAENAKSVAQTYLTIADIKSEMNNCAEALGDYEKSSEYLKKLPEEPAVHNYQIHRGKLFCFDSLGMHDQFQTELESVLKISEIYRTYIREDKSRQTFFDNEQIVFDLAVGNSITQADVKKAFEYVEISKARSLLNFVQSKKTISEVEKDFGNIAKPLSFSEIQSRLPENLQVFEYSVLPEKLIVWKITKTTFEVSETAVSNNELDRKISDYQASLQEKVSSNVLQNHAKDLYNILFPNNFEKGKPICIIPDKSLHRLPFASLISSENRYLIEDAAIFLSPSSSILVLETEDAKAKELVKNETILSFGNPKFNAEENPYLQDLPQAEIEVHSIAKNYTSSKTFIKNDAIKSAFLNNMSKFDVVHFAGHYIANSESPNNSKLLFSDDALKSSELSEKKLPKSKLVILSACDTGVDRFNRSEGAIGIARTFLAMGSPLVLASGWKVDSEATKILMIDFHKKRRTGKLSSIESLRQSQLEMIKSNEYSMPYYWSAFTLTGGFANY